MSGKLYEIHLNIDLSVNGLNVERVKLYDRREVIMASGKIGMNQY